MERVMTEEERIRRAEEIYNRRRYEGKVRVSTSSVNINEKNKLTLGKKMLVQIIISVVIYFSMYLIQNIQTNNSEYIVNETKYILNYDTNFAEKYYKVKEYFTTTYNKIVKKEEISKLNEANQEVVENEIRNVNEENINEQIQEENEEILKENIQLNEEQVNENIQAEEIVENEVIEEVQNNENKSQMELDAEYVKKTISVTKPIEGTITSGFGDREPTEIISAFHQGIDIGAVTGTSIKSAIDGTVIEACYEGEYGNCVKVKNGTILTVYAHCSSLCVSNGQKVSQGQEIAKVGATGKATGPHLHFEIRNENRYIDPKLILDY